MQSVIVYSNPLEAAIWESGMVAPLLLWLVIVLCLVLAQDSLFRRFIPYRIRNRHSWYIYAVIIESLVIGCLVIHFLGMI